VTVTGRTHVTLDRELCGNVRLKIVHDRAVGHITVAELERSNVTYAVPVTVNCSYCTDYGYGKYPKHVE
jgi:hypothetical protein